MEIKYILLMYIGVILVIGGILLVKNYQTFKHTNTATYFIFTTTNPPVLLKNNPTSGAYFSNFLHPLKWTYKQMFPRLYQLEKEQKGEVKIRGKV